ncbi:MAG: MBL fold metallo-hydrolase, partial [Candidatus Jordarchaeum sp.]|uniref:MBL fold metallo-hydrolase n=1 Tax=Candidatus Jordarchaeum sp. TaxID=2823881 RepID=UPI00404B3947
MSNISLTDNIIFIQAENRGKYPYSNSLLIDDEVKVLIDTGFEPSVAEKISKDYSIDLVINSHCHEDHIARNHNFEESKICAHKLDAPAIRNIERLWEIYGVRGSGAEEFLKFIFNLLELRDGRVDLEFEDGYVFDLGNKKLQVIHTPGHSYGHCSFLVPEEGVVFLADIDLTSFGPWYGALDCSVDDFIASIEKLIKMKFEIAVTSHKGDVFKGEDVIRNKLEQYLDIIYQREEKLLNFLKEERTLEEIVDQAIVYRKFPDPVEG